ncbi:unnamed protein product [Peronospora effusa]|nr:unnamed protein product [Peronospora effusa]
MTLLQCQSLVMIALLVLNRSSFSFAIKSKVVAIYNDSECSTTPLNLQVSNTSLYCKEQTCSSIAFGNNTYYYNTSCISTDAHSFIATVFTEDTRYIMVDQFRHSNCSQDTYLQTHAVQHSSDCVPFAIDSISMAHNAATIATIHTRGSVSMVFFSATNCSLHPVSESLPSKSEVTEHTCYQASKFYISSDMRLSNSSIFASSWYKDSGSSSNTLVDSHSVTSSKPSLVSALIIAAVLLILGVIGFNVWKCQSTKHKLQFLRSIESNDSVAMLEPDDVVFMSKAVSNCPFLPQSSSTCSTFREPITTSRSFAPVLANVGSSYQRSSRSFMPGSSTNLTFQGTRMNRPWEDDFVVAARIPRDKVVVIRLLSRGGFGVVYSGLYFGRQVAVKMLLPETRRSIPHVVDLLAEVKIMASMEHPHIVEFIGVAWDSLTNMCVVSEFMAGGDLKALLSDYDEQGQPTGFNKNKLKIALHIAHALTYMHSLDPPIIHRDLKSKNVLLNKKLDAKLTDFGTSRERVNESMTGGVGTCLWMAPEVMIGDRYDDKADMFSFGVVLSELDTHVSPYWHVKDPNDSNRPMPEPAILQMVATGKLRVKFSNEAVKAVAELGNACVSVDPQARPTASEALYKLHTVLAEDVEKATPFASE